MLLFVLLFINQAVVASPSSRGTGNEVDMEQLYLWNPEVIIFDAGSVYNAAVVLDAASGRSAALASSGANSRARPRAPRRSALARRSGVVTGAASFDMAACEGRSRSGAAT